MPKIVLALCAVKRRLALLDPLPKAIGRMTAYLQYERPTDDRMIVDEMLAISEEIEAWREKKESQASNMAYNELLYYGLE